MQVPGIPGIDPPQTDPRVVRAFILEGLDLFARIYVVQLES